VIRPDPGIDLQPIPVDAQLNSQKPESGRYRGAAMRVPVAFDALRINAAA